jgi:hypothetical protein
MLHHVAFVRSDVLKELSASFIRVIRIASCNEQPTHAAFFATFETIKVDKAPEHSA